MTWPLVVLTLGVLGLGVALYVVRAWRSTRVTDETVRGLKAETAELRAVADTWRAQMGENGARLKRLEDAMRIDGSRIMAEAAKASIPNFMR